jgi:hypothetical protein
VNTTSDCNGSFKDLLDLEQKVGCQVIIMSDDEWKDFCAFQSRNKRINAPGIYCNIANEQQQHSYGELQDSQNVLLEKYIYS